jgi:nitronate monooxygenase
MDAGASAILLSFGGIRPFANSVHAAGRMLVAQVQTLAQAREAEAEGVHIIVAQGGEGGGHSGVRGTLALVPAVVDAVKVPVVAAGGIADGRGLAAALALGAQGVLCGTAFYAAEESLAHPAAKQLLTMASGDATTKGELFDVARGLNWPPGPWGLRTLQNALTEQWHEASSATLRAHGESLQATVAQARLESNHRLAPVIAGEAADLVRKVEPAALIVERMVATARQSIERLAQVHRTAPDS